jgi:hypothetical protein
MKRKKEFEIVSVTNLRTSLKSKGGAGLASDAIAQEDKDMGAL